MPTANHIIVCYSDKNAQITLQSASCTLARVYCNKVLENVIFVQVQVIQQSF